MTLKSFFSFAAGFVVLFFLYHFPEFFNSFWISAVFKTLVLVGAYIIARMQGWKGWEGYGLGKIKHRWLFLVIGLCIGILFFSLSWLASILFQFETITKMQVWQQWMMQLPQIMLITFIPSLAEDILTRGYWYVHFSFLKSWHWVLLSAIVFVLNHIWRLNDGWAVLSYLFLLGIALAITIRLSHSLWPALGIHWGANLAYQTIASFITTENRVEHAGSTWLLAAAWALLVVVLLLMMQKKAFRKSFHETFVS
ncbi:CPBP family intramembrane glutamic endopeptidase [Hydrotalea sandarakina]|jgi:membrane protease YdiL (CAAX protease family)|uniref:CAAX prenyl protease 2/Lysostaphin resistance protein A-like domain-containing protein n=1 Tax=Hydrotalea sandarakina TaxID=1004304 RepID=A0A2W7RNH1_9BACT|nr:CPBP family intramembrane glutamic endopeptidase [Hydrotalea sandarakina]PZX62333.1 hypothetical protein LX80_01815 [Hydrotalea sandarakina]